MDLRTANRTRLERVHMRATAYIHLYCGRSIDIAREHTHVRAHTSRGEVVWLRALRIYGFCITYVNQTTSLCRCIERVNISSRCRPKVLDIAQLSVLPIWSGVCACRQTEMATFSVYGEDACWRCNAVCSRCITTMRLVKVGCASPTARIPNRCAYVFDFAMGVDEVECVNYMCSVYDVRAFEPHHDNDVHEPIDGHVWF